MAFGVLGMGRLWFGVWGWEFGVWGLGFRISGLGFGVWGLGFGVWGLGFGVWGFGFSMSGYGILSGLELLRTSGFVDQVSPRARAEPEFYMLRFDILSGLEVSRIGFGSRV